MSRTSLVKGGKVVSGKVGGKKYGSGTFIPSGGKTSEYGTDVNTRQKSNGVKDTAASTYQGIKTQQEGAQAPFTLPETPDAGVGAETGGESNIGLGSSSSGGNKGTSGELDLRSFISSSAPSVNGAEIGKNTKSEFRGARRAIGDKGDSLISDARDQASQEDRALRGGMGTGRRFSSSAEAFINYISTENDKKIADLEIQKETALANFDFQLANLIETRISNQRQTAQQEFNNAITMYDRLKKEEDDEKAKKAGQVTASREGAVLGLINQGINDAGQLLDYLNYDDEGNLTGDFSIEEVTGVLDAIQSPRGFAQVVLNNPSLFKTLTAEQMADISPILQDRGFNFAAALKPEPKPETEIDTYTDAKGNRVSVMYDPEARTTRTITHGLAENAGMFEAEANLRKEFNGLEVSKQASKVKNAYNAILGAYQEAVDAGMDGKSKAAADQVLITAFNKMIDPDSVVREGEYARSVQGQSWWAQLVGRSESALSGGTGLTDSDREQIVSATENLFRDYINSYNKEAYKYRGFAGQQGAASDNVATYLDTSGIIEAENAQEGDILMLDGSPYQFDGENFIELEGEPELSAEDVAEAIRMEESGGNYEVSGASGEYGAYQFMPETWRMWASETLGDPDAPKTQENQDLVAKAKIQELLDKGYGGEQIALIWNGGQPVRKAGVNKYGVKYDSGAYADRVLARLNKRNA
jgi:hypothetical protein